jgi:hypothetical protein
MIYGNKELIFAKPFAEGLVNDPAFRSWVLRQTKFADFADEARLLHREMKAKRSARTRYWWRSHFTETCRCPGCSGRETDLLAIFETATGLRFALHVEVKHPGDEFKDDEQAPAYPVRARCWSTNGRTPAKVLPHTETTTALLCSELRLEDYAPRPAHFETVITFEDIKKNFPNDSAYSTYQSAV